MKDWRIYEHPILKFDRGNEITIHLDGVPLRAFENETIAAALFANGVREFSRSIKYRRPRGYYCAIGRCSSCLMEVDGAPNVRTCVTKAKDGMHVRRQTTAADHLSPILNAMKLSPQKYMRIFTRPRFIYKPAMKIMRRLTGMGEIPEKISEKSDVNGGFQGEFETDFLVVGGGPAGMSAAIEAGERGVDTILVDDKDRLGGQLIKQTHMFFGDVKYSAGRRGFQLGEEMVDKLSRLKSVKTYLETSAVGYYPQENTMLMTGPNKTTFKIRARKYLISTGAYEKYLVFENNDLPGIYGAGGVQTLLNVYGVKPGKRGIMLGTGNVALIVAYHLIQAGVELAGVYAPSFRRVRGYLVHASKVRSRGVPIVTRHTIVRALGRKKVEGAIVTGLDTSYEPIPDTQKKVDCDFICISVGLNPAYDLVQLFKPKMVNVRGIGLVPVRDKELRFTKNAYIAGDCGGIEEATTAMLEGRLVGLYVARSLSYEEEIEDQIGEYEKALEEERGSQFSAVIKAALKEITVEKIEVVLN